MARLKRKATRHKWQPRTRGQALVEFALILPILLLLVAGIFDFGRALFVFSEVSNSAREAVRYGTNTDVADSSTLLLDCTSIRARAVSMFSLPPTTVTITAYIERPSGSSFSKLPCATTKVETGDRIRVEVNATVELVTLQLLGPLFGNLPTRLPITYAASRTLLPPSGISTGPTTTPMPFSDNPAGTHVAETATSAAVTAIAADTATSAAATAAGAAPGAPTLFSVTASCNGQPPYFVNATWAAASGTVTSYEIFQVGNGTPVWTGTGTNQNHFSSISASTDFYIVAYNGTAAGPQSNTSTGTCGATSTPTPSSTPSTPTATATASPTNTPTPTGPTNTPTSTPTNTPTPTPTTVVPPGAPSNFTVACGSGVSAGRNVTGTWTAGSGSIELYRIYDAGSLVWSGSSSPALSFATIPYSSTKNYSLYAVNNTQGVSSTAVAASVICGRQIQIAWYSGYPRRQAGSNKTAYFKALVTDIVSGTGVIGASVTVSTTNGTTLLPTSMPGVGSGEYCLSIANSSSTLNGLGVLAVATYGGESAFTAAQTIQTNSAGVCP
jgi:Flp pilus assembly protein TadG/cell division septation protein DedD